MRRIYALLLAVMMVCTLFAGCSGDGSGSGNVEGTRPQVVDPGEFVNTDVYPLEGEHQLTMAVSLENAQNAYLLKLMSDAVGVDFTYRYVTTENARLMFVDRENMPDVIFSAADTFGLKLQNINDYGSAGALVNYIDHLDKMPNLAKAYMEHPDLFDGVMSASGEVYTLPYYVYTLTGCTNIIYFRGDHLAQVGWEKQPATVDELTQLLKDLKAHYGATDPEYVPMSVYEGSHADYDSRLTQYLFTAFGEEADPGVHIGNDGKAIAGFATEQYKEMTKYIRDLMKEGLLYEGIFTAGSSKMQQEMNENHTSVSTRMLNIPESSYADGVENFYISQPLTSQFTSTPVFAEPTIARKWGAMISTTCEDLDAALAYMDALFAPKSNPLNEEGTIYNLSLWLGEEGVDWEWVEEGKSYKEAEKPFGWSAQNGFSGTPYIGKFHAMRMDHTGKVDLLPKGVYDNCLPYAKEVIRDEALALNEDENDIYVEEWPDIHTYADQMFGAFVTGEEDIDAKWDEYVANLNKMGLQEVLECYDAAYARYTAR